MALVDFGPLVHSVSVDRAIIAFLQRWLPTYLRATEIRESRTRSYLARPVAYATTYDEDDEDFFSDRRLPCVFVTAGEATLWRRDGDGSYSATYRTRITTVSRARNKAEARYQASLYCATVTELLIGRAGMEGIANGVEVVSERPRPIVDPSNRSRNLAGGFGEYAILVPNVRAVRSGPLDPEPPPPDEELEPIGSVSDVQVGWTWSSPPSPQED